MFASSKLPLMLRAAYGDRIKCVLTEPSTSVVVRSEQQFHGRDRQRLSQRRHFFEVVVSGKNDPIADAHRLSVGCTNLDPEDRLRDYLGFVDLRQFYNSKNGSPLALGLLTVPRYLREDPDAFVIEGEFAPLFGGHSFLSTVYASQDPSGDQKRGTIGAKCAQMCAIMVTGMFADRGAIVKGSFTLTYLAWASSHASSKSKPVQESLKSVEEHSANSEIARFGVDGMNRNQLVDVLRLCKVSAAAVYFPRRDHRDDVYFRRLLEAYLRARFPIVLPVHTGRWTQGDAGADEKKPAHAVVVVGLRKGGTDSDEDRLVVHDPGHQPFSLVRTEKALLAVQHHDKPDNAKGPAYCLIVSADEAVRCHVHDCKKWLERNFSNARIPVDVRTRVFRAFEGLHGCDYQIDFVTPYCFKPVKDALHKLLSAAIERGKALPKRCWCISILENQVLADAWLFDAESNAVEPILFTFTGSAPRGADMYRFREPEEVVQFTRAPSGKYLAGHVPDSSRTVAGVVYRMPSCPIAQ